MRRIIKVIEKIAEFEANNKKAGNNYTIKRIELKHVFYTKLLHELESISNDTRTVLVAELVKYLLDENLMNSEENYSESLKNVEDVTIIAQKGVL